MGATRVARHRSRVRERQLSHHCRHSQPPVVKLSIPLAIKVETARWGRGSEEFGPLDAMPPHQQGTDPPSSLRMPQPRHDATLDQMLLAGALSRRIARGHRRTVRVPHRNLPARHEDRRCHFAARRLCRHHLPTQDAAVHTRWPPVPLPAAARSAATGAAVPLASRPDVPIPHRNVLCWTVVSNKALSDCERSRASWVGTAER